MQKDFDAFIGQGNKLKECHGDLPKERGLFWVWKKKRKRRRKCEEFCYFLCVQESSIERVCVRIRHEKNLCSKYLLQSLWMLVQLVVSLKSTVGFVSKLNQLYFERCKSSSQKFSVIGFVVREL